MVCTLAGMQEVQGLIPRTVEKNYLEKVWLYHLKIHDDISFLLKKRLHRCMSSDSTYASSLGK